MLRITQISRYDLPRYPQGGQYVHPPRSSAAKVRDAAALSILAYALRSCGPWMGGKPLPPKYVTEIEARLVIGEVFAARGIKLVADQAVTVPFSQSGSAKLVVDGFNDSLQVGYEYISIEDKPIFTDDVCRRLDNLNRDASPHIITLPTEVEGEDAEDTPPSGCRSFPRFT